MAKIKLNSDELKNIKTAVKNAEKTTSGEISTTLIKQSYDYAIYELIFAVIIGFVYFAVALFYLPKIEMWFKALFWDYTLYHLIAFYGFTTFLVISMIYFIANIPAVDRLIVPKKIMNKKVHERLLRNFVESGVYQTRDKTGILIFISELEHQVQVLADSGIYEKIDPAQWESIVNKIVSGIKNNQFSERLVEAITDCGKLLTEHFPIKDDDTNELSDDLSILEI